MKKILYLIATGLLTCAVVACDDEPKNPGDFNVEATLTPSDIKSLSTGDIYPLLIERTVDTVYYTYAIRKDTTLDASGNIVSIINDTTFTPSRYTKLYHATPIMLPMEADTFRIDITTNAKWESPQPSKPRGSSSIYNDATTSGGGNGYLIFRTDQNENATRKVTADMYIFTSDSAVMYRIPFLQKGMD